MKLSKSQIITRIVIGIIMLVLMISSITEPARGLKIALAVAFVAIYAAVNYIFHLQEKVINDEFKKRRLKNQLVFTYRRYIQLTRPDDYDELPTYEKMLEEDYTVPIVGY